MARETLIAGIDIGSTMIRIVVGQKLADDQLHIIGAGDLESEGMSKGSIVSIDDAVSAVSQCIEKVERLAGVPIEHTYVSISGAHVSVQSSKGVVAVSKADGEIQEDDVERVIEAAEAVATPPNCEILHVIPRGFSVDGQGGIKDAIGMTGVRLEVEAHIVQGASAHVKSLTKTIYRTGVDIDDIVLAPLAAGEAVLTKRQRDLGVALVVLGGSTTGVAVYEGGDILHTAIVPLGSGHITADLAIGLRTSIDIAETIKVEYGSALPSKIDKKEEVPWSDVDGTEEGGFSRRQAAEIIEARCEEIMEFVDRELKRAHRSGLLPSGVVLTGAGAHLPGIVEVAKRKLHLPASIGSPSGLTTAIEKIHDPSYSVAVGLVLWGEAMLAKQGAAQPVGTTLTRIGGVADRVKHWMRSILP